MLFTLEALSAKYGDALLLHYGPKSKPRMVIIDGGPAGVFKQSLKPRLEEIAYYRDVQLPLRAQLVMVSHVDADHIAGIIDLLKANKKKMIVRPRALWHNAFDKSLPKDALDDITDLGNAAEASAASLGTSRWPLALAAGIGQGVTLRDLASEANLVVNSGSDTGFVSFGDRLKMGHGLTLRVLAPDRTSLAALRTKWDAEVASVAGLSAAERQARVADFVDDSVQNLASIVVWAQMGRKTMLLTGDARGDHVLKGLRQAKLLKNGRCTVDILKMPHHGSDRNVDREFFKKVRARHYVFSGDGNPRKGANPDKSTVEWIVDARGKARYTMHFTFRIDKIHDFLMEEKRKRKLKYKVEYLDWDSWYGLWIDLGEALDF